MSRILSDHVALARDNVDKPDRFPQRNLTPSRLFGHAARLLARSNAVYGKVDYRDGGSLAEPHTSRHAGWKP